MLHDTSHATAGAVVFLAFGVGTCTQLAASRLPSRPVILGGLLMFLVALALIIAGLSTASMPLFLIGTVVSGVAVGAVFMGSLATANRLAPPDRRGQVISTYFIFSYVGLTVPVIAVGFGSQAFGDFRGNPWLRYRPRGDRDSVNDHHSAIVGLVHVDVAPSSERVHGRPRCLPGQPGRGGGAVGKCL